MFIDQVIDAGPLPVLERAMQFAARRHEVIAHNVANLSTPDFIQKDVSIDRFQAQLREAIDRRRSSKGSQRGPLEIRPTREVEVTPGGSLRLSPQTPRSGVLFHDRNNRDLERLIQDLVENMSAFRVASDLLKSRMDTLRTAIRETT